MSRIYKHEILILLKGKGIDQKRMEKYAKYFAKSEKGTLNNFSYFKKWNNHSSAIVQIDSGNSILHPPKPRPVPGPIYPSLIVSLNKLTIIHFGLFKFI